MNGCRKLPPFAGFTEFTHTLPSIYWDVYSSEQRIKCICEEICKIISYLEMTAGQTNENTKQIEELKALFKKFQESGFDDYYREQVEAWINNHMEYIYDKTMKNVFFGLTDDGYFCGYIPDGWDDVRFDTGMVYGRSDYGRLILRYDVEGQGVIDNTYEYTLNNPDKAKIMADIETVANLKRVPLNNADPERFDVEDGSYIQNGYIVTVDCQVMTKAAVSQTDPIIDNLPIGDTMYSSFSCIDGDGKQRSIYVDENYLKIGDEDVNANTTLFINGTYFTEYPNI